MSRWHDQYQVGERVLTLVDGAWRGGMVYRKEKGSGYPVVTVQIRIMAPTQSFTVRKMGNIKKAGA